MSYVYDPSTKHVCANCKYWCGNRKQAEKHQPTNAFQRFLEAIAPYNPYTAEVDHSIKPASCSVLNTYKLPASDACINWECWNPK